MELGDITLALLDSKQQMIYDVWAQQIKVDFLHPEMNQLREVKRGDWITLEV